MNFRTIMHMYGFTWSHVVHGLKNQSMQQGNKPIRQVPSCSRFKWLSTQTSTGPPLNSLSDHQVSSSEHKENQEIGNIRGVGRNEDEQISRLLLPPDQPADARILRVAIIGLPNSGKSTLTNRLLGWRVSSVSKKVHTTRKNTSGIMTQSNVQIVFLDTPGILDLASRKRHNLEKEMVIDPERSLQYAHLVAVVVDVSNRWTCNYLDPLILQILHLHKDKPTILVLNKVDILKQKQLLLQLTRELTQGIVGGKPLPAKSKKKSEADRVPDFNTLFDAMEKHSQNPLVQSESMNQEQERVLEGETISLLPTEPELLSTRAKDAKPSENGEAKVSAEQQDWTDYFKRVQQARRAVRNLKGWPHFSHVFMVSALSGDGIADLKDFLIKSAHPGDWDYHSSLVTTQNPQEVVLMCVREKLLEHLKDEVPYILDLDMVLWEVDKDGILNIIMNVIGFNKRHVGFLLRHQGKTIQTIAQEAKQEMMNTFRCEIRLKLIVKMTPKKRRSL
ncbi:GTPase Era, mitochondrial-like isoform X2 [Pomacea canaliculata]|uniref:GTPase Era, mitochondrial-like isoform X2 n=1 Tax=Pomacea canaliculata TaxID=400727 RepID=UPI000D73F9C7|nr:GTPase Era, mitochondrial-like isoform X2 [Pomacea canaliculata]